MRVQVITLFPDGFRRMTDIGVTGRAIREQRIRLETLNPRDFATDRHRAVDDRPYGGGPGMVMMVEPMRTAIRVARKAAPSGVPVSLLSPQGVRFDQTAARNMAARGEAILVCGRYEGVDERLVAREIDEEWSIGDYVLSGGELAAAVVVDTVARLVPGVLGGEASAAEDSFSQGLLDHPHYTRPERVDDDPVPEVLLSGDHEAVRLWRRKQSLGRTWERRPDLFVGFRLSEEDKQLLTEYMAEHDEESGRQENEGRWP